MAKISQGAVHSELPVAHILVNSEQGTKCFMQLEHFKLQLMKHFRKTHCKIGI